MLKVEALFSSIPIDQTLLYLDEWLGEVEQNQMRRRTYLKATKYCMASNFCQFNDKFHKIVEGKSMSNALSPFLANIFMSRFETNLSTRNLLPRVWLRYVDDVSAVIKINYACHCLVDHKEAALSSIVVRLCKLPLSTKHFADEPQYIKYTAIIMLE